MRTFPQSGLARISPLFIVLLLLAACSKQQTGRQVDSLQLARFYADNGSFTLALSTLGQRIKDAPDDPGAYQEVARIYYSLGYYSDALAEIDQALAKGCSDLACRELRLKALIALGKSDQAADLLASLEQALPAVRRDLYRIQIDLRQGRDHQAALDKLAGMDLDDARSEYLALLFAEKRYQDIVKLYEQRKGKHIPLDDWLVYAKTLYLLKRYEEADRALIELRLADKSDMISPRKILAVELQVKNNIAQNKFAEAQAIYDAFLENYKGSGYVVMQEAVKDLKSRNFDAAIKNMESLVEASPDNLQSAMILALARFGKGEYRSVIDILTLFRDKLNEPARSLLAKAYLNLGQAEPVLQLIPENTASPLLRMDRASAWLLKGNSNKARSLLERIDRQHLRNNELLQYAQLLDRLGEWEQLIQLLSERNLRNPRLQRLKVSALVHAGRGDEAEQYARSLSDPRQSLELQIHAALQRKDREKALTLQRQLTADRQLKTDDARLAALLLANNQMDEGFEVIKRGFDKPGDNRTFVKMIQALLRKNDNPKLREWIAARPKSVDGYDELQLLLAEAELRDQPERARQRLQPLVEKNDPRAVLLLARSQPEQGGKVLEEALQRKYNPRIARLLYQYYLKKGDKDGLRSLLRQVGDREADTPRKHVLLARGYLGLGNAIQAQTHAEALEKQGLESAAYEIRGDIQKAMQQPRKAIASYARALERQPSDLLAAKYFQTRLSTGEPRQAVIDEARSLLERQPGFVTLKGLLAAVSMKHEPEQARRLYEEIIRQQPGNVTAINNLAWLNLERNPRRALELSARAYRLAPTNLNVADTLIRALNRNGETDKARELLDRLREKNPDSKLLEQLASQLS